MKDEVQTVVRRPLAVLEEEIRKTHGITAPLADVSVDDTFLTLVFSGLKSESGNQTSRLVDGGADLVQRQRASGPSRRRRRRRKRNRIRTAGWEVIAKSTNSKGLRCNIYKPLYEALK